MKDHAKYLNLEKKLDPEIQKTRERFKNGETNTNLRRLGIPWAPGHPEPTNVKRILKYTECVSSTDTPDEGHLSQAQKFVRASKKSLRKRKP